MPVAKTRLNLTFFHFKDLMKKFSSYAKTFDPQISLNFVFILLVNSINSHIK